MDEIRLKNCINIDKNSSNNAPILDKLAQLSYAGINPNEINKLQKRAKAKYFTNAIALGLINSNPNSDLKKAYWNTYYCNNVLRVINGVPSSKYCKNRFCLVCTRIKTATAINSYFDVISSLPDKQFVTLTIPNVQALQLPKSIDLMQSNFRRFINSNRNRNKFQGIRKLEPTYNPYRNDYHPHYHIILGGGYSQALQLLDYWLSVYPDATIKAQDIRPIKDDDTNSLIELFKYATKIIQKDIDKPTSKTIYFEALDVILRSLRGRRTFQPFGIKKLNVDDLFDEKLDNEALDINYYEWEQELSDWLSIDTGDLLSGYSPTELTKDFVSNIGKKR